MQFFTRTALILAIGTTVLAAPTPLDKVEARTNNNNCENGGGIMVKVGLGARDLEFRRNNNECPVNCDTPVIVKPTRPLLGISLGARTNNNNCPRTCQSMKLKARSLDARTNNCECVPETCETPSHQTRNLDSRTNTNNCEENGGGIIVKVGLGARDLEFRRNNNNCPVNCNTPVIITKPRVSLGLGARNNNCPRTCESMKMKARNLESRTNTCECVPETCENPVHSKRDLDLETRTNNCARTCEIQEKRAILTRNNNCECVPVVDCSTKRGLESRTNNPDCENHIPIMKGPIIKAGVGPLEISV